MIQFKIMNFWGSFIYLFIFLFCIYFSAFVKRLQLVLLVSIMSLFNHGSTKWVIPSCFCRFNGTWDLPFEIMKVISFSGGITKPSFLFIYFYLFFILFLFFAQTKMPILAFGHSKLSANSALDAAACICFEGWEGDLHGGLPPEMPHWWQESSVQKLRMCLRRKLMKFGRKKNIYPFLILWFRSSNCERRQVRIHHGLEEIDYTLHCFPICHLNSSLFFFFASTNVLELLVQSRINYS